MQKTEQSETGRPGDTTATGPLPQPETIAQATDQAHTHPTTKEEHMNRCWHIWGNNATWVCVRDQGHPGGHQYAHIGRDSRRTEDNQVPESVNEGLPIPSPSRNEAGLLPYAERCNAMPPGAQFNEPACITRKGHEGNHAWPCPGTIEEPGLFCYECELWRGHAGDHVVHW